MEATMDHPKRATAILDVHPMLRGSEKAVVEAVLGRRPGVERVEGNPVAQTATVVFARPRPPWPICAAGCRSAACIALVNRSPSTSAIR
jgi:hypothetical protein